MSHMLYIPTSEAAVDVVIQFPQPLVGRDSDIERERER